jgi:lipid II:glycine glycyltransferase (peptidoglycan interpeptide bridge formation enzyme)
LLNDLAGADPDIMVSLHRDTRKQVRRAEREGISLERYDGKDFSILNDFDMFYKIFSESPLILR